MTTTSQLPTASAPPTEHYGFVIYRAGCPDEAQWERFMAFIKHQARAALIREGNPDLYDHLDWTVVQVGHEDGAWQVRRHFTTWLASGAELLNPENWRYLACVLVVQEFLDFVDDFVGYRSLEANAELWDGDASTFVMLVSKEEKEGDVLVGISNLIPRAGEAIAMRGEGVGWEAVRVPEGEIAMP